MAHFAQIDENGIVVQVIVVANSDCLDERGVESEAVGAVFCNSLIPGVWKQTSYSGSRRKNFAGIGFRYDVERDAFIAPQPDDPEAVLNEETCRWESPPKPDETVPER